MTEKKKRLTVAGFFFEDVPNILMAIVASPWALSMYCMGRAQKSRSRLQSILWGLCILLLMPIGFLLALGFAVLIGRYFYISMPLLILCAWYTDKKYGRSF